MIKPCGHRVLIEAHDITEADPTYKRMKELGFSVAETEDKLRKEAGIDRGKVAAIGPDAWKAFHIASNPFDTNLVYFKPWCKVGDFVCFAKYGGKLLEDNGKKYLVINDDDISAVLSEAE